MLIFEFLQYLGTRRRLSRANLRQQARVPYWRRRIKTRAFLLSALLVMVYLLCWAPYNLITILDISFSSETDDSIPWVFFFHHLIAANSALNPLIYGLPWWRRGANKGRNRRRLSSRPNMVFNQLNRGSINDVLSSESHSAIALSDHFEETNSFTNDFL